MQPYTTVKLGYSWPTNRISHLCVPKKERTGERARWEITRLQSRYQEVEIYHEGLIRNSFFLPQGYSR